jgi:DNA repair protein RecO (recombination protein O)
MGLIETEGLVLKSYSLAEADKIVVLLTQNEGLIRGVAKGAKRLKSRFGGGLEPFSVVQISCFQKEERELVSISHIELIKSYFEKASDPEFFEKFAYLVELLVEFSPPHDPNENLYRMAKVCLETASENPQNLDSTVVYFELWILRLGGYLPDWIRCDNCKREFASEEKSSLQINFHLECQNCQKGRNDWRISAEERHIFKNAQKLSPRKFVEFTANKDKSVKEVSIILRRIISNILGRDINAEKKSVAVS